MKSRKKAQVFRVVKWIMHEYPSGNTMEDYVKFNELLQKACDWVNRTGLFLKPQSEEPEVWG